MNKQEDLKTILLVEDEALIAVMEKETLKRHGFNVVLASSGEKAIEVVRTVPDINLILMDINLGKGRMDGTEAAEIILKEREIPILFISSYTQPETVEKTERITSYGYVVKDSGETVLITSIKMAFRLYEANQKLKKSELQYRSLIECSTDAIFCVDEKGQYKFTNHLFASTFGKTPDYFIGKTFWDIYPQEHAGYRYEATQRVFQTGESESLEVEVPLPDKTLYFYATANPIKDEAGRTILVLTQAKDITALKHADEAIKKSEEKFSKAFKVCPDAVTIAAIKDGKYIEINDAFLKKTGFQREEVIGRTSTDLGVWVDENERQRFVEELSTKGSLRNFKTRYRMQDGEIRNFSVSSEIIEIEGEKCSINFIYDITDRKLTEDKIKSLLSEKSLLLREVHHRIKNNMVVIAGMLLLQADTLKDPSAAAALEDATNRIRSMMILYDKLYQSIDFRAISIKEYITSLVDEIVANFHSHKSVTVETEIGDYILEAKTLSPIGIILNELLTNAMKHAFTGIENGVINISLSVKNSHATLIVHDNGIGIPESINMATSTGFGLQLVNMLTEQLGGTVRIERGKGARFVLEFEITP
jgi:PAS domain S-box-containing protein